MNALASWGGLGFSSGLLSGNGNSAIVVVTIGAHRTIAF
jgi:hypothetical protein